MSGAIFYSGKYGSTKQYAEWIGAATGLDVHSVDDADASPAGYDYLVLGSSIIYYRVSMRRWIRRHADTIAATPTLLFTVSGAPAGPKLDGWIAKSLPEGMAGHVDHVALQGRQRPSELTRFDRLMLRIAATFNRDRQAAREELEGFDYMDESSIEPIVERIGELDAAAGGRATR